VIADAMPIFRWLIVVGAILVVLAESSANVCAALEIRTPKFVYRLDTDDGLRGVAWENQLTGKTISLGNGPEVELDFDAAEKRIPIGGWRMATSPSRAAAPDNDQGFRDGYFRPEFDDSTWRPIFSPAWEGPEDEKTTVWTRTEIALPSDSREKPLSLTIGGFSVFDYRYLRAFLNGHEVGVRNAPGRWREPLTVDLSPHSKVHEFVLFGKENLIALQLSGCATRLPRLEQLNPSRSRSQAMRQMWPGQFEQYFTIGTAVKTPKLEVVATKMTGDAEQGIAKFELKARDFPATANVSYRWERGSPVLRKFVEVANAGDKPIRLLNVRLGSYRTDAKTSDGEQGFPVYLNDECFMSLAHPSGWAIGDNGDVRLRHYPGATIEPGKSFSCMETVLGVALAGEARSQFLDHVRSRMRRMVRGHVGPYGIFSNFGSWSLRGGTDTGGWFDKNSEEAILHSLDRLGESQQVTGPLLDYFDDEFWFDLSAEMNRYDPVRFSRGGAPIYKKLDELGVKPGLWMTSTASPWCSLNPKFAGCCSVEEPFRSAFIKAHVDHIRDEGVRLFKFDCLSAMCNNPGHHHLPGVYSTEAIHNAVMEMLRAVDKENPSVLLMLYWGYRSPWWLLDADTIFEPGVFIEGAHPGGTPTLFARDSVTQGLDQAHFYCEDVPALGKDSLGIWLSDWWWNSSIGKERWQAGFVMDMGRGSLLPQLWADWDWLSPPEWKEMETFFKLEKTQPKCFDHCRLILGNPWKNEPYGYCCTDGRRAFFCLNNCTWMDQTLALQLNSKWGLPNGERWDLYRWYPRPAHLTKQVSREGEAPAEPEAMQRSSGADTARQEPRPPAKTEIRLAMRPFDVVLLEAVHHGEKPGLDRVFDDEPLPTTFSEPSRRLDVKVVRPGEEPSKNDTPVWMVLEPTKAVAASGAKLTRQADHSLLAEGQLAASDTYTVTAESNLKRITAIRLDVLADASLPQGGPGRAANGNFALMEFRVAAAPKGNPAVAAPVKIRFAKADFAQQSFGGWPIAAAIDGNGKTGWSIDPQEGRGHVAIFELETPIENVGGTVFTFTLEQGCAEPSPRHLLGRLRSSATGAAGAVPLPSGFGPEPIRVRSIVPPTKTGGTLVFTVELQQNGHAWAPRNTGSLFRADAIVDVRSVSAQPVLGNLTYEVPWQAWRLAVGPASEARDYEVAIRAQLPQGVEQRFSAYFVPE
jgi:hypothetical protein